MSSISSVVKIAALAAALNLMIAGGAAHAITDTVFRYSTPQTGFLNIPPTAQVPQWDIYAYLHFNNGVLRVSTNAEACFAAPVYLPERATVREFAAWYSNGGGTLSLTLSRMANSTTFGGEQIATTALSDTGGVGIYAKAKKSVSGGAAEIDNSRFSYWMGYCAVNAVNATLLNVRITYTYRNAGD
jgi:hypothetical protein